MKTIMAEKITFSSTAAFSAVITDIKFPQQHPGDQKADCLVSSLFTVAYGCRQIIMFDFGAVAVKFCKQFDFCELRSKLVESLSLRQHFSYLNLAPTVIRLTSLWSWVQ